MKESHTDPKKLGEHPEMHRLGEHPEAHRLSEYPAPGSLPAHDDVKSAAAPLMGEVPATTDAQEARGVFRGAGWVALALLAIMVAAALIWRPRLHNDAAVMAGTDIRDVPSYSVAEVDGIIEIDSIVELTGTVSRQVSGKAAAAARAARAAATAQGAATPSAVVVYLFNTDNSEVPETASLTAVARQVAKTGKTVVVKAFTDETGNPAYNRRLSEKRARAIGDYMIAHGVPASKVKAKGYGPTHAYATNAQDRRAEVTVE